MSHPCVTCVRLPKCKKASPEMVILLEGCGLHEGASEAEVSARIRAIDLFGPAVVTRKKSGKVDMNIVGSRKYLRKIAVAANLINLRDSFMTESPGLVNLILTLTDEGGAPVFPNIAEMTDEELQAVAESVESGGATAAPTAPEDAEEETAKKPASKKPAAKRTRRKKKEEPVEPSEEAASEPEEAAPAPAKKPSSKKPAPKKPAARRSSAKKPSTTANAPDSEDMKLLLEMVRTIGAMMDTQASQIESLKKSNKELRELVTELAEGQAAIDQHLAWSYNMEAAEPGNEISSLQEISWI